MKKPAKTTVLQIARTIDAAALGLDPGAFEVTLSVSRADASYLTEADATLLEQALGRATVAGPAKPATKPGPAKVKRAKPPASSSAAKIARAKR